jgi:hypothetical protein
MGIDFLRREFITLLGGAAALPVVARAQQPGKPPTIGFVAGNETAWRPWTATFVTRLRELGWIENRTIAIEYRWGSEIRRAEDISPAFRALTGQADALYVTQDALTNTNRMQINTLALAARVPTVYGFRDMVEAGGLMSYGANNAQLFRRAAEFVDKILRGANPADLPVEQPTKFDLVINLTTAKALGLTIPEPFLLRADEVIE